MRFFFLLALASCARFKQPADLIPGGGIMCESKNVDVEVCQDRYGQTWLCEWGEGGAWSCEKKLKLWKP